MYCHKDSEVIPGARLCHLTHSIAHVCVIPPYPLHRTCLCYTWVSCAKLFRLAKFDGFLIYDSIRIAMLNLFSYLLSVWDIVSGGNKHFLVILMFLVLFSRFPSNLSHTRRGFGKYPNFDIFNYYLKGQIGRKTVNI